MKQRVYLDTSVLSAMFDDRAPDRKTLTVEFWARRGEFELATSEVARLELTRTRDLQLRDQMLACLAHMAVHPVTQPARDLALRYIDAGMFTINTFNDALHVAVAVLTRQDVLLSWNFKHLVNRNRRAAIHAINIAAGLPAMDIITPPELG